MTKTASFFHRLITPVAIFTTLILTAPLFGATASAVTVSTEAELRNAISSASSGDTITIGSSIELHSPLNISAGQDITFSGSGELVVASDYRGSSPLAISSDAKLTLDGVDVNGNSVAVSGSLVTNNGSLTLNSGSIHNANNTASYAYGGALTVSNGATFTMNGGSISDNACYSGAGIYLNSGAKFYLSGGTISNNKTASWGSGGAIFIRDEGSTPTEFHMTGGSIENNYAYFSGGAIYIRGNGNDDRRFSITGGNLSGNDGGFGGALYIRDAGITFYFENVVIFDNLATGGFTASYNKGHGGGIANCSTGVTSVFATNGGAIFANTANGSADDIGSAPNDEKSDSDSRVVLSERILGGGKPTYYKDGAVIPFGADGIYDPNTPRFDPANPGDALTGSINTDAGAAIVAQISQSAQDLAKTKATTIMTNNKARAGGGAIFNNGRLVIGVQEDYKLSVKKIWQNFPSNVARNAEVALVSYDAQGKAYQLDTVKLDANTSQASFTGLPTGKYSVQEINLPANTTASYDKTSVELNTNTTQDVVTITNTYTASPVKPQPIVKPIAQTTTSNPKTLDRSHPALCAVICLSSAILLSLIVLARTRSLMLK